MPRFALITLASLALAFTPACNKAPAESEVTAEATLSSDAFIEEHEGGTVAWNIGPDGQVKAVAATTGGQPIRKDVSGTVWWKVPSAEAQPIPLVLDPKTGLLVAKGPKLEADLTEVSYTINVGGKPWSGVLHLPAGGTVALVSSAKATAEVALPADKRGPHGGTIQVVGNDRLELVSEEGSPEVRVYVLDPELRIVRPEGRTIKLGVVAERPDIMVLSPAPTGLYFVGTFAAPLDPFRLTVALSFGGTTHVALWGYRPGVRVVATSIASAPRVTVHVKGAYAVPDVNLQTRGNVDVKVQAKGASVKVQGHDDDDNVKAKAGIKVHGPDLKVAGHDNDDDVKAKAGIKVHGPDLKAHGPDNDAHGGKGNLKVNAHGPDVKAHGGADMKVHGPDVKVHGPDVKVRGGADVKAHAPDIKAHAPDIKAHGGADVKAHGPDVKAHAPDVKAQGGAQVKAHAPDVKVQGGAEVKARGGADAKASGGADAKAGGGGKGKGH
jgi:hypothetical protein